MGQGQSDNGKLKGHAKRAGKVVSHAKRAGKETAHAKKAQLNEGGRKGADQGKVLRQSDNGGGNLRESSQVNSEGTEDLVALARARFKSICTESTVSEEDLLAAGIHKKVVEFWLTKICKSRKVDEERWVEAATKMLSPASVATTVQDFLCFVSDSGDTNKFSPAACLSCLDFLDLKNKDKEEIKKYLNACKGEDLNFDENMLSKVISRDK